MIDRRLDDSLVSIILVLIVCFRPHLLSSAKVEAKTDLSVVNLGLRFSCERIMRQILITTIVVMILNCGISAMIGYSVLVTHQLSIFLVVSCCYIIVYAIRIYVLQCKRRAERPKYSTSDFVIFLNAPSPKSNLDVETFADTEPPLMWSDLKNLHAKSNSSAGYREHC